MISVVINTFNEEKNLPKALASVRDFADEIVVVDMYSDDDTVVIAKREGAKVFEHKRTGYVEPARNFAVEKTTGDWIFILDADEEMPKTLADNLKQISSDERSSDYYAIPRKNIVFGKWMKHSRWWPDYNIRFFKKGMVTWGELIHSIPITKGKGADLEAVESNAIIHRNYISIDQYVDRLNRYTTHQTFVAIENGYKFSWPDLIKKPTGEFVSRYFYGEGYKDGIHGLSMSLLQAFSELVLYLKIWQKEGFEEKSVPITKAADIVKNSQKEINYWVSDTLLKEKGGILYRIKRKFKLL